MIMAGAEEAAKQQFVNFAFYKVDPLWRRLPKEERDQGKQEFVRAAEEYNGKVIVVPYTTTGIQAIATLCCGELAMTWKCFKK